MKKNVIFLISTFLLSTSLLASPTKKKPLYKDAKAPTEQRVADLLSRMTLHEKICQLNQYTLGLNDNENNVEESVKTLPAELGSVIYFDENPQMRNALQRRAMEESRLGIPLLFGNDIIHGFRTIYPIPLAQACSWNTSLSEACSRIAARESRLSGTDWVFSPMIDVARDARWGRIAEGYGEDPYTNAAFAVAAVHGYQGDTLASTTNVASCLKHFVGYGASEAGRDYVYTEISRQTLWDTYLPPYEAGIKAGAATVMSGFNNISGVPATINHYTLTEILKNRWAFDGFVDSDWTAITQLIFQGVAENDKDCARLAILAGVDMDIIDDCYMNYLEELVNEGKVPMERIDDAVSRILRLKFRLGLFEKPYTEETPQEQRILKAEDRAVAAEMAAQSMVLLENKGGILPLTAPHRIALIGPLAKSRGELLGSWTGHGHEEDVTTIYDALMQEYGEGTTISFAQGSAFDGEDRSGFAEALKAAQESDVVILCLGEKPRWSGENAPRADIALPAVQQALLDEVKKAGKPVVVVLVNGRPLNLSNISPKADAVLEAWQPGISGGTPMAGILSGRINPSGRLAATFPRHVGQIPIYYNQRPTARRNNLGTYLDMPSTPLYEFGYGQSYTTFSYGALRLSSTRVRQGGTLRAEIDVTNSGARDGMETVHWYICDPVCTISRPVKELRHFEKAALKAGETKTFTFTIDPLRDLGYVDEDGKPFLEPGDYYIIVKDQRVKVVVEP